MKFVVEQLQELMTRLEEIGQDTIATYEQAQAEGIRLSSTLLETLGEAYGLAQVALERAKDQRKTND
jgi:hypothetical protein